MAFYSEIFDQLRDLLNDPTDTQVTFPLKKLYVNRGISLMWPRAYKTVEQTVALLPDTYEYALAAAVMDGHVLSVEIVYAVDVTRYHRFDAYDIIPGDEDQAGKVKIFYNPRSGDTLRIRYVAPIALSAAASYAASQSETWVGPDRAIGLPVLYAMGMIALRKVDDRQDTTRYSTTQALNGVSDQDIMAAAQTYFGQFEVELDSMTRVFPPARD